MVLYHPIYIIHPETARICKDHGIKIEFDPTQPSAEYRRYFDDFLSRRPEGDATPITFKIKEATRIRSRDRRNEFIVWTENQSYIDNLKNEVTWQRRYCGIYKIPKVKVKTVADGQGGTKTEVDSYSWITMYEFPWNEDNCKQVLAEAENPYELQLSIQTEGIEEVWGFLNISEKNFEMWSTWPFEALLDYARTPSRFQDKNQPKALDPLNTVKLPEMSKNELFPDVEQAAEIQENKVKKQKQQKEQ